VVARRLIGNVLQIPELAKTKDPNGPKQRLRKSGQEEKNSPPAANNYWDNN